MHIVIVQNAVLPVTKYGGTERVVWYLAKELVKMGNKVTFVANKGSKCDFANVIPFEEVTDISKVLPSDTTLIHAHTHFRN